MILSLVFSFKNEEENIEELVKRLSNVLKNIKSVKSYELIFVNDASDDNSLHILQKLKKKFPLKILTMARTFGVTPCVLAGFSVAKGDAIIYMDSDLQDPPELIPSLIEKFNEGYDVIHTVRNKRIGESVIKLFITKLAYKIINALSDVELIPNAGDFKLLSKRAYMQVLNLQEVDPYMRGLSAWIGYRQTKIYYDRHARFAGNTHFSLFGSINPIREFTRGVTSFSVSPLYISLFVGALGIFCSILIFIYALIAKYLEVAVPGSTGIILLITFFSSLILISNGFLGIYIARIYNQVKSRPLFVIDKIDE